MYIIINYPYGEDLTEIEGAEIVEWIDDNTVALDVDFQDLDCRYRTDKSLEHYEAEGARFAKTFNSVNLHHCKFGCHHVLNEDAVEEYILDQEDAA
jgi:hypothetical protein